jgi:hypothetical protein
MTGNFRARLVRRKAMGDLQATILDNRRQLEKEEALLAEQRATPETAESSAQEIEAICESIRANIAENEAIMAEHATQLHVLTKAYQELLDCILPTSVASGERKMLLDMQAHQEDLEVSSELFLPGVFSFHPSPLSHTLLSADIELQIKLKLSERIIGEQRQELATITKDRQVDHERERGRHEHNRPEATEVSMAVIEIAGPEVKVRRRCCCSIM